MGDVKMKRVTGTGALSIGRNRIKGISVLAAAGTPRLTITDGNGGPTILDLSFIQSSSHTVDIPGDGILSSDDPHVSALTNITAATIFYG
jgi:hypothetical protein